MGKKAKKKGKTSHKLPVVTSSTRSHAQPEQADPPVVVKDPCEHYEMNTAAVGRALLRLQSGSSDVVCEDCRDETGGEVEGKRRGKGGRKKGGGSMQSKSDSAPATIWVCLKCSHFSCAGGPDITRPCGHAGRHHKQNKHVLAVRLDDPRVCWCFSCHSLIRIEMPEGADQECKSGKVVDSGESVDQGMEVGTEGESFVVDVEKGYAVRGLINLGNTCFFNSIMQNLFAMDMMRDYLSSLNAISGPLTMALKKLFRETSSGMESTKGIVNPKNFFGCICSKAPQFKGYQQQDSHELLRYLLDGLSTEGASSRKLLSSPGEDKISSQLPSTFVDGLFGGQICSTVCCIECGHTSVVHEPFLDLSLPVPAKKVRPKKVAAAGPQKAKLPPSSTGWRSEQLKEERVDASLASREQPDPNASYNTPVEEQAETTSLAEGEETWLDFIGPASQTSDNSAIRDAEDMGVIQGKNDSLKPAQEPGMLEEPSGEKIEDSPMVQDSEILLLPYKDTTEASQQVNKVIDESQTPGNTATGNGLMVTMSTATSSSSGCEPVESEFDGLGNLFADPETTSDLNTELGISEDPETSWLSGYSCESAQEEVDNTDAPISVDSCLAYFTMPELLSGEHAWHCENCFKILQHEDLKNHKLTVNRNDGSETFCSKVSDDFNSRDNVVPFINGISVDASQQVLENVKLANSAEWEVSVSECCGDADSEANGSKKSHNIMESFSTVENSCQSLNGNCSELANTDVCQENCSGVSLEEGYCADSGTSKYFSCTSSVGKANCQFNSSDLDSGSCSNNNLNDDACGAQTLVGNLKAFPDCTEEIFPDTCGNGGYNNYQKVRKKRAKFLPQVLNSEELEPENVTVKRDATKTILIYKAPPILTIHLKRFFQDACGRLNKLSGHVSFQEILDLAPYMDQSCRGMGNYCYHLIGVVEHSGNMRGGHYIAYVRGQRTKENVDEDGSDRTWFYTSDTYVREASLSEVLQSEAYILFYERVQP